jgi:hypothetical protein
LEPGLALWSVPLVWMALRLALRSMALARLAHNLQL